MSIGPNPNKIKKMHFLRAIELAEKCASEDERPHPKVGVVIVRDGEVIAEAYRGQIGRGDHAEFIALERIARGNAKVENADLITTLEPCTKRSHDKHPCVSWIKTRRIRKVWIGTLDFNPAIQGDGESILRNDGILIGRFPDDLQLSVLQQNKSFFDYIASKQPSLNEKELEARLSILREMIFTELIEFNKREYTSEEEQRDNSFVHAAFERILAVEVFDVNQWNEIGWLLLNGTLFGASGYAFQTATKIDNTFAPSWIGRGTVEIGMYNRLEYGAELFHYPLLKAIEYLDRAYELDKQPEKLHYSAWRTLFIKLKKHGYPKLVEKCRERAISLNPKKPSNKTPKE